MKRTQIHEEVEITVGAWVGIAAVLIVQASNERKRGKPYSAETKHQGGQVLARLAKARLDGYTVDDLEHAAFLYAPDTIRQCCNTLDDAQVEELIVHVLAIVKRVVRQFAN